MSLQDRATDLSSEFVHNINDNKTLSEINRAKVTLENLKLPLSVQIKKPAPTNNRARGSVSVTFSIGSTSSEKKPPCRQESNLR